MDEARRVVRYVLPGIAAATALVAIDAFAGSGILWRRLLLHSGDGLTAALGALIAAGGAGYLLGAVYFGTMWTWPGIPRAIDHRSAIERLGLGGDQPWFPRSDAASARGAPKILVPRRSDRVRSDWIAMSAWWYARLDTCSIVRGAYPRVKSLVDTVHMLGTTVAGTVFGAFCWAVLLWSYHEAQPRRYSVAGLISQHATFSHVWVSLAAGAVIWAVLFFVQVRGYMDARSRFEGLIETIAAVHRAAVAHDCLEVQRETAKEVLMKTAHGVDVACHDYGTDIAFSCPACGHPVLATPGAPPNIARGNSATNPCTCPRCMTAWWVDGQRGARVLNRA